MKSQKPEGDFFRYIDIASIDNKNHKIVEPKIISVSEAPSRASRKLNFGDTIFSMVRPYLKNIAFIDENYSDCIASTGFFICSPNDALFPKFLFHLMTSKYVIDGLNSFMKGDNSPSINNENIINFLFPLPPLQEQHRIVSKIEEVFALIDTIEQNQSDLKTTIEKTKAKVLDMAICGELLNDENHHLKISDNEHYTDNLPKGWKVCYIKDIAKTIPSKSHQILQSEIKNIGKIPVISQSSSYIEGYSNDFNKVFQVDNFVIVFGDHTRNVKYIDFNFIVGADGVKIIYPNENMTKYFYYLLLNVSKKITDRGYSRHYQFLQKYPLNIPPLEEQKRIVQKIEEIFSVLEEIETFIN